MTKHKSALAVLLSIMITFTFMPTMAFATDGDVSAAAVVPSDATNVVASVVTARNPENPIYYDSFRDALYQTNRDSQNSDGTAVITLLADPETTDTVAAEDFVYPLTIDLNGHKLGGAATLSDGLIGGYDYDYLPRYNLCIKKVFDGKTLTTVKVSRHNPSWVCNWAEDPNGTNAINVAQYRLSTNPKWKVVSFTEDCPNCIAYTHSDMEGYATVYSEKTDKYSFGFANDAYTDEGFDDELDSMDANTPVAGYSLEKAAAWVTTNGRILHENGLPVAKAKIKDLSNNKVTEVDAVVTAATDAEIAAAKSKGQLDPSAENKSASCLAEGVVIYKTTVTAPDETEFVRYLVDDQAAAKTDHVKGAIKGFQIYMKSDPFDSAEEAIESARSDGLDVVEITTLTKQDGGTFYFYWAYYPTYEAFSYEEATTGNVSVEVPDEVVRYAAREDGSLMFKPVYYCDFQFVRGVHKEVVGDPIVIEPLDDATTAEQAAMSDGVSYKYSDCMNWKYAPYKAKYQFRKSLTDTVKNEYSYTLFFSKTRKNPEHFSHTGSQAEGVPVVQPTCDSDGYRTIVCDVCGRTVRIPISATGNHSYDAIPSDAIPAGGLKASDVDPKLSDDHTVTLNTARTEVVVAPTCEEYGGTYKYCKNEPAHWVLQGEKVEKLGHSPATIAKMGRWKNSDGLEDAEDAVYHALVECTRCHKNLYMDFHSKDGTDYESNTFIAKYNSIKVVPEDKGKDCKTPAKTTYTVEGMQLTTGPITKSPANGNPKGDHTYTVKNFNWDKYTYEHATVTVECTTCGNKTDAEKAEVTKETGADGITTFTATYGGPLGGSTDTKRAYSLTDAEVTYDTSKITDGNQIGPNGIGVYGAYANTPEVTVTVNGTVIDNDLLDEYWSYNYSTKKVSLYVDWKDSIKNQTQYPVAKTNGDYSSVTGAYAEDYNVATKKVFGLQGSDAVKVKYGDATYTSAWSISKTKPYKPGRKMSLEVKPYEYDGTSKAKTVTGATIKYAVFSPEDLGWTDIDEYEETNYKKFQKQIESFDYDLDAVEVTDTGIYCVFAQISKDGYTTCTTYVGALEITKPTVKVSIDNFTMRQGETPNFNMAVTSSGTPVDVDPAEFTVTSAGGQALSDLLPGDYKLLVTAKNYIVETDYVPNRVGTVTVLTKEGQDPEEEAKAAAEAADKALADASKITTAGYTADSVKAVQDAQAALKAVLTKTPAASVEEIKAATAALNDAIAKAVPLKANDMKVKVKKVKAKTSKKTTKKAVIVKKAEGKVTIKKANKVGGSKIVVKNNGKVVVKKGLKKGTYKVKVKVTAKGDATHKAKTVKKTVKVVVK